ncbi:MAG: hypothetical protein HWE21_09145 [Cytophagia bacterium]|nr:hypothetical protein [Cytophagia bacterium]
MKGFQLMALALFAAITACGNKDSGVFTATTYELEEAYDYLIKEGFMTDAPKGERGYNPQAMFNESAENIMGLIMAIFPNKEPALVYYLEVAGANLEEMEERDLFIDKWTDRIPWFAIDLVTAINYIDRNPDNEIVNNAMDNIMARLDTDETLKLLVQQSFIRENMGPDGNGNGVYTILPEFIQHWPIKFLRMAAQNIRSSNPGADTLAVADALESIIKEKQQDN